ncbi:hypothetical protein SDC9_163713 [bioreactor metagenome]|uniref:Uncharacterized protein n=1 Tax=bioreactor metagenome TaxID=1076179 RepID=A0A645FWR5_9ZZZZ
MVGDPVIETKHQIEVIINLVIDDAFDIRINADELRSLHHLHRLVDQMHAPIVHHAAAIFFVQMPFMDASVRCMQS